MNALFWNPAILKGKNKIRYWKAKKTVNKRCEHGRNNGFRCY